MAFPQNNKQDDDNLPYTFAWSFTPLCFVCVCVFYFDPCLLQLLSLSSSRSRPQCSRPQWLLWHVTAAGTFEFF